MKRDAQLRSSSPPAARLRRAGDFRSIKEEARAHFRVLRAKSSYKRWPAAPLPLSRSARTRVMITPTKEAGESSNTRAIPFPACPHWPSTAARAITPTREAGESSNASASRSREPLMAPPLAAVPQMVQSRKIFCVEKYGDSSNPRLRIYRYDRRSSPQRGVGQANALPPPAPVAAASVAGDPLKYGPYGLIGAALARRLLSLPPLQPNAAPAMHDPRISSNVRRGGTEVGRVHDGSPRRERMPTRCGALYCFERRESAPPNVAAAESLMRLQADDEHAGVEVKPSTAEPMAVAARGGGGGGGTATKPDLSLRL